MKGQCRDFNPLAAAALPVTTRGRQAQAVAAVKTLPLFNFNSASTINGSLTTGSGILTAACSRLAWHGTAHDRRRKLSGWRVCVLWRRRRRQKKAAASIHPSLQ